MSWHTNNVFKWIINAKRGADNTWESSWCLSVGSQRNYINHRIIWTRNIKIPNTRTFKQLEGSAYAFRVSSFSPFWQGDYERNKAVCFNAEEMFLCNGCAIRAFLWLIFFFTLSINSRLKKERNTLCHYVNDFCRESKRRSKSHTPLPSRLSRDASAPFKRFLSVQTTV
jgi:hypothetical protein